MKLCLVCHLQFPDEQDTCPKDNTSLVTLAQDPLIGTVIQERYKIESVIGKGSMGVVYRATQELIGREVAVKVLHSHLVADSESRKRFHQQAKASSRLNHPHIITLYDFGILPGSDQPYIVMDLLTGTTLARVLEERDYLPVEETLPIMKQVCDALADAHKHGVVHRDVKPDNIVLEEGVSQQYWVKVVDFGIAKLIQGTEETLTRITRTGTVCGSPAYMSPEQFQGADVDHRSDIYSLGVVLFEVLTGRVPFAAVDLVGLMAMHVAEPPPKLTAIRPDLDFRPALEKMVDRALSKEPKDRQQSMDDFWDELAAACGDKRRSSRVSVGAEEVPPVSRSATEMIDEEALEEVITSRISSRVKEPPPPPVEPPPQPASRAAQQVSMGQSSSQRLHRSRTPRIAFTDRLIGLGQSMFPYALTLGLFCCLVWVVSGNSHLIEVPKLPLPNWPFAAQPQAESPDPAALLAQGRLGDARNLLEQRQREGSFTNSDRELLNRVYIRIGEQEAQRKNYRTAIDVLQRVTAKTSQSARAKSLIKRYRRLLGK